MNPGSTQTFVRDFNLLYQMGTVGGLTDRELLGHFTARDSVTAQQAFEAIVHRHGPMVLGVCRRVLRDEHAAEDAFQATFLVLALKAGTIRARDSLGPWLHGVAARICRRQRALAHRRGEQALAPGTLALCVPEGSEVEAAELRSVLDEEIDRLPAAFRRAIVLCYLEGKTQEDAARELGCAKGTVLGRLARAKDLLRARLGRCGLAPSAGLAGALLARENAKAAVPSALSNGAVRTALSVALGWGETIAASGSAVALARGALRALLVGKVKAMGAAVLMLVTFAAALAQTGVMPEPSGRPHRAGDRPPRQLQPVAPAKVSRTAEPKLPEHARARLGTTRLRHQWSVTSVAFAPNGRTLVSTGWDGPVRFWDLATGEPAVDLPAIKEPGPWRGAIAQSLACSPDGIMLAIGHYGGLVQLWDLVAGRERFRTRAHKARLYAMAFAPDGRTFATASNENFLVRIWDVATGQKRRTLPFDEAGTYWGSLAFSADGKRLAFGAILRKSGEGIICIWNLGDCARPIVIRKPHDFAPGCNGAAILAAALTLEGMLISGAEVVTEVQNPGLFERFFPWKKPRRSSISEVRFWDAGSGKKLKDMDMGPVKGMSWLTVSRDGKTLVTTHDDRLLVWDLASEKIVRTIPTNGDWCGAISPDGRTLAGGRGNTISLWDIATGKSLLGSDKAHDSAVAAAIAPGAHLAATADRYGIIRVWDPIRAEVVHTLEMRRRNRATVGRGLSLTARFSSDGQYVAAGDYHDAETDHRIGTLRLWDVQGFRLLLDEQRIDRGTTLLEFSPDGRRAAAVFSKLPFPGLNGGGP